MAGGTVWVLIPDFNFESASPGLCTLSGLPRRTEDVGVFRPLSDDGIIEGEGYIDVSQVAIEDAALMLGWRSPAQVEAETEALRTKVKEQSTRIMQDGLKIKRLQAELDEIRGGTL
jgi:hypothetical protein